MPDNKYEEFVKSKDFIGYLVFYNFVGNFIKANFREQQIPPKTLEFEILSLPIFLKPDRRSNWRDLLVMVQLVHSIKP